MSSQLVSVIIPNFNYGRYISAAIDSALNQTYTNIEIIVVNNGSTDNSLEVIEKYGKKIKLINQPNLGQSGARNSGLSLAQGDFLAFLDADDFWHPAKIEKQVSMIREETQLVYCGITRVKSSGNQVISQELPEYRGNCSEIFLTKPGVSIVLSGESTALFSKSLCDNVGLFDTELNSAAGWDYFRRCSKYTFFDFVPEPLSFYRIHKSNMSVSSQHNISDIRNAYKKLFSDSQWKVENDLQMQILIDLEYTFLKTHAKELHLRDSLVSLNSIWKLSILRKKLIGNIP